MSPRRLRIGKDRSRWSPSSLGLIVTACVAVTLWPASFALAAECPDADQDGFADCSVPACDAAGLVCGDCDDASATVHPGAVDACNHVDDNCSGLSDEGYPRITSYRKLNPDPVQNANLGSSLAAIGDITGDGIPDIAAGAPLDHSGGKGADHGTVTLLSVPDSRVICKLVDPDGQTTDNLGRSVAHAGDLTGDGVTEILAGVPGDDTPAGETGSVAIFSASDCSFVRKCTDPAVDTFQDELGTSVAGLADLNGDNVPDFAAGAPKDDTVRGVTDAGAVVVFSGADCTVIHRLIDPAGPPLAGLGASVSGIADLTGDGTMDIITGAAAEGAVLLFSGANGAFVRKMTDPGHGTLGTAIAALGDLDGDGLSEIAAGEPSYSVPFGTPVNGRVVIFSGATGGIFRICENPEMTNADRDRFGSAVAPLGDVDADGMPDLGVGAGLQPRGKRG